MKTINKIPRVGKERDAYFQKLSTMNEYERLVENICTSELSLTQLQAAYSESLRRSKHIPEAVWNILTNDLDKGYIGTLDPLWSAIKMTVAAAELVYRRGIQHGSEKSKQK